MNRVLTSLALACLMLACDAPPAPNKEWTPPRLTPLAPFSQVFSNVQGTFRIDYFYTDRNGPNDAAAREDLRARVEKIHAGIPPGWSTHSIYVYKRTATLNDHFTGNADDLRGVYDDNLICFCRWNRHGPDVFYLIENGNVVFDMLENKPVAPTWEFD
ncbi:MAG: hypothetical protein PHX10_02250 [Gallionellaceae bacterium]|nr:hypothetical protein [Gallionellaceae bacterium]